MQKHRTKQNMAGNKNWNTGDEQTQTKQHQEENRKRGGDTRSREETKVEWAEKLQYETENNSNIIPSVTKLFFPMILD